jgi:lysophospholipid acyltransferase (LPLAT)-like uncharacterized protein
MRRFLVWLSAAFLRLIGSTLRLTVEDHGHILNRPDHPPVIIAFWHNRVGLMAYFCWRFAARDRTMLTFISASRDGQFITDIAARFSVTAVRGSTSRRGMIAALKAIRAARDARTDLVITPDGPRGPRYQIQPGLLRLAQATGRPIVAITYNLAWKGELDSWDRFHVPIPFSSCKLITREPIMVPVDVSDEELAVLNTRVAEALGGD